MKWYVYVLISQSTGTTYVGVALDVQRRLGQHNGDRAGGARRTRMGRPWRLEIVYGPFPDRSEAQRNEYQIKRLRGRQRLHWIAPNANTLT